MKRIGIILVVLVLSLALLVGCSQQTTTTAPAQTTAAAPATSAAPKTTAPPPATSPVAATSAAPVKPIELKWTSQFVLGTPDADSDMVLLKMINERTGGRVNITYYPTETLGKSADWVTMLKGNVAQIGTIMTGIYPGQFDLENILDLPMLGVPDRSSAVDINWQLFDKGYYKGLADFKLLGFKGSAPLVQFFREKKLMTIDDYKGMKMRGASAPVNAYFQKLGATPVAVAGPEIYMSMDRKVIDGYMTAWSYVLSVKLYEVSKYCLWNPPVAAGGPTIVMSKQAWDSLPADIQKIIDQCVVDYKTGVKNAFKDYDATGPDLLKKNGVEVYTASATEAKRFIDAGVSLQDDWVKDKESKGFPAKAAMDTVRQFVANIK